MRRYKRLRTAAHATLTMVKRMEEDQALRLPFPRFEETLEALRKELE